MEYIVTILSTVALVMFAAIFSGLNISLMSLSLGDLQRKAKLGNINAIRVLPLRRRYHLSLSSILFANVAVVSISTLNLEQAYNGLIAGVVTTILMVVFGEVLPQAIFVRSALRFCSFFAPLIHFVTLITYPISKPLSMALDRMMGIERRSLHSRLELGMLIGEHKLGSESELDEDEVEIIQSALQLSEKQVREIMRPIASVYWLANDAVLDAATVDEIKLKRYSRVPVFNRQLTICYGVLLMKDMVDIDFDEHPVPIAAFKLHKTEVVGSRTALDTMFRKFFTLRTHLVPIEKDNHFIGIVTVEDLVEEIIGHEIADETDHMLDRQ